MDITDLVKYEKCAIIDKNNYRARMLYLVKGKPWSFTNERFCGIKHSDSLHDEIYKAKVLKVLPALGGAFVEIEPGINALLPFENGETFKEGEFLLVQVKQDAYDEKQCKVSQNLCFLSDKILYFPKETVGVSKSKQLNDDLADLTQELQAYAEQCGGTFVLRRSSIHFTAAEIMTEAHRLVSIWETVKLGFGVHEGIGKICTFGSECDKFIVNLVPNLDAVYTNDKEIAERITSLYKYVKTYLVSADELLDFRFLDCDIEQVTHRQITLQNKASLVFDYTEACCFVDINSGSSVVGDAEEAHYRINCECADELLRQLSLRNIGGAVIVDFITMKKSSNKNALIQRLRDVSANDFNKVMIYSGTTHLGMVELTRLRTNVKSETYWTECCESCGGMGKVLNFRFYAYRLIGDLRALLISQHPKIITVKITKDLYNETKQMHVFDMIKDLFPATEIKIVDLESEELYDYAFQL